MRKGLWRYVPVLALGFMLSYVFERTGSGRYGGSGQAVTAEEVDWGGVVAVWLIGTALFFAQEIFRSRRKGRGTDDETT